MGIHMSERVTRSELVSQIANKLGVPAGKAADFLKAFEQAVTEALANGKYVVITGFGRFKVSTTPKWTKVTFKAGNNLKRAIKK